MKYDSIPSLIENMKIGYPDSIVIDVVENEKFLFFS
jgi:hypothetical protein